MGILFLAVFIIGFILFDIGGAITLTILLGLLVLAFKVVVLFYPVFIVLFLFLAWKIRKIQNGGTFKFYYKNFDDFANGNYERFYRGNSGYSQAGHRAFENMDKYYELLGVEKNSSSDEIKSAYKKLVRKYHPDANPNISDEDKKKLEEKLQKINEAYEKVKKDKGF